MPTRAHPQVARAAFESLDHRLQQFDARSRERGHAYWLDGAVGALEFLPGMVRADVEGTSLYDASWSYSRQRWLPECDCPVGPECKHSYALALELLDMAQSSDGLDPEDLILLFSDSLAGPDSSARAPRSRPPAPLPAHTATPPAPTAPRDMLREFRLAGDPLGRLQALMRMLPPGAVYAAGLGHGLLHDALEIDDADHRCWEVARLLMRHQVPDIPPGLEAYLERTDISERVTTLRARALTAQLAAWAARRSTAQGRSLRLVISLAPARRTGMIILIEARVTTPRISDQPRTVEQLRQFRNTLKSSRAELPDDQFELLGALVRAHEVELASFYDYSDSAPRISPLAQVLLDSLPSPLVRWSERPCGAAAAPAGVLPGEVVGFSPAPASVIPDLHCTSDGGPRLTLTVCWPDGTRCPAHETLFIYSRRERSPDQLYAVLHKGVLSPVRSALPEDLVENLLATPMLPLTRAEAPALLSLLTRVLPEAREAYQPHIATHSVRLVVALDLDEQDRLDFRLFALTPGLQWPARSPLPPGEHVFEWGMNEQWTEFGVAPGKEDTPAPAPTGGDREALLHQPDPDCVLAGVEWLRSTGARPVEVAPGDVRRVVTLTARTVPQMADVWARRPAGVEWVGTRAVQALLAPGAAIRARVSAKRHGVDLLQISANWESELRELTDEDIARLRAAVTPWVRLSGGWVRREANHALDQTLDALADLGIEPGIGPQPLSLWQMAQARPESLAALESLGLDAASVQAVRALRNRVERFAGLPRVPVPRGFRGELRPYQRHGLDFLAWTASMGLGAVLADDMGLGKTVQALAWLQHLRARAKRPGPALVVCPASVVHNWEREARAFTPSLRVRTLTSGTERAHHLENLGDHDLLITNFALLRQDAETWRAQSLFAMIVDEAQMIKNPAAAISKLVCELRARHRLALTGTPLENRALDLWSIVRFVNPGYLGSERSFLARFDRADAPAHARRLLTAKLRPMLLRRLKREVAPELPERVEERRDCEMSPGQRKLYLAELARARREVQAMTAQGGIQKHKIQILAALTRLRQVCCHPALAGGAASLPSGKFEALFELLEPLLAEGHKVLVFSQFVRALELVSTEMKRRDITHFALTGSTTDRPGVVRAFEQHPESCVFLISLRAGGTGLNLTAANYVVLLDPWWNPAVEAQAIDRTHRIGQDRTVIAYRLLMQGTIEERIWELQQRKAALASDVLGEDGFAKAIDREALDYLFAEG